MGQGGDQQGDAGLPQDVLQLVRPVGRVDVHHDDADTGGGVLDEDPLGAVDRPDADPVALGDALGEQGPRHLVDGGAELGVGPAPSGRHVDEGLAVRVGGDRAAEVGADGVAEERGGAGAVGVGERGHRKSSSRYSAVEPAAVASRSSMRRIFPETVLGSSPNSRRRSRL